MVGISGVFFEGGWKLTALISRMGEGVMGSRRVGRRGGFGRGGGGRL